MPYRGLVHPRTRAGGGARWIQVPAVAGTQETMGGAGVSAANGVPLEGIPYFDLSGRYCSIKQAEFLPKKPYCDNPL